VYLAGLVYLTAFRRPDRGEAAEHVFSVLIPAHNEESVIERTVERLLLLDYPADRLEILVVNDGSSDRTGEILEGLRARHPGRVRVLHVPADQARRGKAMALNRGFAELRRVSDFRGRDDWVIGIFDADGVADRRLMRRVSHAMRQARVGGVQCIVRVYNRRDGLLARLQDVEFSGFTRAMQLIRVAMLRSTALGGNGQFVRAAALLDAWSLSRDGQYWKADSLAEDLELSTRIILRNWDFEFIGDVGVQQEGVETARDLYVQRTRWAWGYLQVFADYVLRARVARISGARLGKRLDMFLHFMVFLLWPLVAVMWLFTLFAALGIVAVTNFVPAWTTILFTAAFLPILLYGLHPHREYRSPRVLVDALLYGVYAYHWIPCYLRAMVHMLKRDKPHWARTPRIPPGEGLPETPGEQPVVGPS